MTSLVNPLDYAKSYLSYGWSLVPILPKTKIPPIKWSRFQEKPPTLEEVTKWLDSGWWLAVVTGEISGVLIIDDDRVKNNLPEWGFDSPVISQSKSGGKHYYFKQDREIHTHCNLELHIDLKGWHSYCLLPPFDGRVWIKKPSQGLSKMIPLSDELVRLINSDVKKTPQGKKEPLRMDDFLDMPDGQRTNSLYKIGCSIFAKMNKENGLRVLSGINQTYNPPLGSKDFEYQTSRAYLFAKEKTSTANGSPASPLSLTQVAVMRKEDRELEKHAPLTGYPELDTLVRGFLPKHFWTLTGETNAGKTALACNLAEAVRKQKKRVLYVALEPENKVIDYLASARLNKEFEDLTDSDLAFDDRLIEIFTLAEVPTYEDLILALRSASNRYDLVIIDHVGYFCRSSKESSFVAEQGETIRGLVSLTKELHTCIIGIAHPRKPSPTHQHTYLLQLVHVSLYTPLTR